MKAKSRKERATTGFRPKKSDEPILDELSVICPDKTFSEFVRDGLRMYLLVKKSNPALDPLGWVNQTVGNLRSPVGAKSV